MSKFYVIFLTALLSVLAFSCNPGPGPICPDGEVTAEDTNECVENTCLNYECGGNQHCVVTSTEPICVCDDGYTEVHAGYCAQVNCQEHAQWNPTFSACTCVGGYVMGVDGKTCIPGRCEDYQGMEYNSEINQCICDSAYVKVGNECLIKM